jgi:CHAT domain-containing protein
MRLAREGTTQNVDRCAILRLFYAGARSLLVSHWEVDSEAAVAITTGAVNAMKATPGIGRAEALRSAEAALITRGGRFAHPSVWAPFVLVGNGGR